MCTSKNISLVQYSDGYINDKVQPQILCHLLESLIASAIYLFQGYEGKKIQSIKGLCWIVDLTNYYII